MFQFARSLTAVPLVAAVALTACGGDDPVVGPATSRPAPTQLALSASEYSLDTGGVRSLPAGAVTVSLRNTGHQDHGLQIYRLKDGVTFARFRAVLRDKGDEALLSLASSLHGGTPNVPPGKRSRMTMTLPAGTYALEDFGETPGSEHNARDHGMVTSVQVTPSRRPDAAAPANASAVSIARRRCRVPGTLPRRGTLAVSTHGSGLHEFVMTRVKPGAAARELRSLTDGDDSTYPTGEPADLLSSASGSQTIYVATDLRPGAYVAMCASAPPTGGKAVVHGRITTVR